MIVVIIMMMSSDFEFLIMQSPLFKVEDMKHPSVFARVYHGDRLNEIRMVILFPTQSVCHAVRG